MKTNLKKKNIEKEGRIGINEFLSPKKLLTLLA